MTAKQIEKDLRILEVQFRRGDHMPYVEYERKKRQLENRLEKVKEVNDGRLSKNSYRGYFQSGG